MNQQNGKNGKNGKGANGVGSLPLDGLAGLEGGDGNGDSFTLASLSAQLSSPRTKGVYPEDMFRLLPQVSYMVEEAASTLFPAGEK